MKKVKFAENVEKSFADFRRNNSSKVFRVQRPVLMKSGFVAAILLILATWYFMPFSKVSSYKISGNKILSDEYVCSLINLDEDTKFDFCFPPLLQLMLQRDPMISKAEVELVEGNIVRINITENQVAGYRSGDTFTLLFCDQKQCEMKSAYMKVLAQVPYITGFEEQDDQRRLIDSLKKLSPEVISNISEISQYPMPYDALTMKMLMKTGSYVIAGFDTVHVLNSYLNIYQQQNDHDMCLYAQYKDENRYVLVSRVCPWNEPEDQREYWTNDKGEFITNKYGDKVLKQYYKDSSGETAVDENGNPIPIPVDKEGIEIIDEDFQMNYENGWYSTGKLVIPESLEEKDEESDDTNSEEPEENSEDYEENEAETDGL